MVVIKVQRACNGCGRRLRDVTEAECWAAVDGEPLSDVTSECPVCNPVLAAYRTVALHHMAGHSIVDCRPVGGPITWGVNGPEITPAEMAALRDLWAELGEPDELLDILAEETPDV